MQRFVGLRCVLPVALMFGVACNVIAGHESPVLVIVEVHDAATNEDVVDARVTGAPDVTTCAVGETSCDGRCVSLANDQDNCGRCGRRCDSASCVEGRCPARLVTLIGDAPGGLAEKAGHLYWTTDTDGTVKRVPKTGGTAQTLATLGFYPSGLVLRDGFVYVATQGGTISRVPEEGGAPFVLATTYKPAGLALFGDELFFVQYHAPYGEVGRVPIGGGAPLTIATAHNPLFVAANAAHVYYAAFYDYPPTTVDDRGIWRVAKTGGGGLTQLLVGPVSRGLPIDGAGVYTGDVANGAIVRIEHDGGAVVPLAGNVVDVATLCADELYVYFASTSGAVGRVAKSGGPVSVLAVGPLISSYISFMTVDESMIYWTASGQLLRTPK